MKCMKMKVGLGALAVVLGLAVLGFTKPGQKVAGLLEVGWNHLVGAAQDAVPIDAEIARIANEVEKLGGDIKENTSAVIKEEVATERLRDEVEDTKTALKKRLADLTEMRTALKSGGSKVNIHGKTFSADAVQAKFDQDWESYKSAEAAVKAKEALVEQKQKQIEAVRGRIDEMKAQQDQLRTTVAKMRADLESARLAQAQSNVQFDDSRLANIKESVKDVNDKIKVLAKQAEENGRFASTSVTVDDALKGGKANDEFDARYGTEVKADK